MLLGVQFGPLVMEVCYELTLNTYIPTPTTTNTAADAVSDRVILLREEKLDEIRHVATERQLENWRKGADRY